MRVILASFVVAWTGLAGCTTLPAQTAGPVPPEGLDAATVSGIYAKPIRLYRGRYVGEPFVSGGASRPTVTLLPEPRALLDVDGDGDPEWLVVLAESSGGSGTFHYLAVMGQTEAGFRSRATVLLGDRVQIERISLEGATIRVDLLAAGKDEPACCPSEFRTRRWQWVDRDLHPVVPFAGALVYGHEAREFVACDGQHYWVVDASGGDLRRAYEAMKRAPYQPLFVEIWASRLPAPDAAFAAPYEEQLRATALHRLETEGPGCTLDLAGARFRASGVEPFWHVDVGADTLSFSRLGQTPIIYSINAHKVDPSTRVWRGQGPGGALTLTLQEARCTNPMSGSVFAYTATVTLGAETFTGCALAPLADGLEMTVHD